MEVLHWLAGLRTPLLDTFFSLVTHLGEEAAFILAGLLFFWCIEKKQGYFLLTAGFAGTLLNQFLKLFFRIPRPWVLDESFTIVESARAKATGYSFPSGHTQNAVGVFGGVAWLIRKKGVIVLCGAICLLVPFSRMYLGVHTPLDTGVALIGGLILLAMLYPVVGRASASRRGMRILFSAMLALSAAYLAYTLLFPFPADTDPVNLAEGTANAFKILGCVLGMFLAYEIDDRFIRFPTGAVWWAQILKLVLGAIPLLAIKSGLKQPLLSLAGGQAWGDTVRYFLVTFFAGAVWPLTFRFFSRLGRTRHPTEDGEETERQGSPVSTSGPIEAPAGHAPAAESEGDR